MSDELQHYFDVFENTDSMYACTPLDSEHVYSTTGSLCYDWPGASLDGQKCLPMLSQFGFSKQGI